MLKDEDVSEDEDTYIYDSGNGSKNNHSLD